MITKAEIQLIRSLSLRSARSESGLFVAEGRKLVEEAAASSLSVRRIYSTTEGFTRDSATVSSKEMERMSHLKTPTDALALVEIPHHKRPSNIGTRLTLMLDNVQDPGNMGTIIRMADWFGIDDIVCSPQTVDCFNPKVVQATMGAILRVRVHYCELEPLLQKAKDCGTAVYGTFLDGENIYEADLAPDSGIVVMGNEGRGISSSIGSHITRKLFIPPYPPTTQSTSESLNVAIATAIVCAEFRRRK